MDYETERDIIASDEYSLLRCTSIQDNPLRMPFFNEMHLEKLTASIKKNGLFEPLLVSKNTKGDYYQIISGHYRIRALRRNKETDAPCRIFSGNQERALRIYCSSYLLSRALNPLEEAHMIKGLLLLGKNMTEIGLLIGHHKSWVSRRLKLLKDLDPLVIERLSQNTITPRLAQELTKLPQGNQQNRVLKIIERENMTKDQAAEFIRHWQNASEQERKKLENNTITNQRRSKQLQKAFQSFNHSLLSLEAFIKKNWPELESWPKQEWLTLYNRFMRFACAIRTLEKRSEPNNKINL